jgi:deferrochelatase/peroxidase EfeB
MADIDNIQALVVRSSAKPLVNVLLFRLADAGAARQFVREYAARVPRGAAGDVAGRPEFHLLFSWSGLEKLLRGHPALDVAQGRRAFEVFFADPTQAPGSLAMARQLGFIGASAPERWWDGRFVADEIDLAIYAGFDTEQKAQALADLRAAAARFGLTELALPAFPDGALGGNRPGDGRLHFGYRDGITAPDIDWSDSGRANAVDLREILVGYPNDDYPTSPQRGGPWQDFARDGSHVALAWIYQDVATFNQFLQQNSTKAPPNVPRELAQEWIAAKMLGRWRDGSPLSKFPDAPPNPPEPSNDFGYAGDPGGLKCPITAHIRVANGRDQPLKFANQVRFPKGAPRVIRRGFSYGPKLEGLADDGVDRGLVGLFCFARVNEQFYTVLRWLQKTDFSDAFKTIPDGLESQDGLFGNRGFPGANKAYHIPAANGSAITLQLPDFIRYKGVAVFFAPSMKALEVLSSDF